MGAAVTFGWEKVKMRGIQVKKWGGAKMLGEKAKVGGLKGGGKAKIRGES